MQTNSDQQRNSHTLVSIIIPNYNKANFIEETLHSVIAQSWQGWEALVVDDGSTDNSIEIIKRIAEKNSRIKFFQRQRQPKGGSTCRNIGIANATGKYLFFFDSDDLMAPHCLEERISYMEQNPELDFAVFPVGTFYKAIGDNQMVWRPKNGNHLKKFLSHDLPWNIMSPIWKTKFVKEQLKGFDEAFPRLQDVEFHTRALMIENVAYTIKKHATPQCFYRIDLNRNNHNPSQTFISMQRGIELYIQKFEELLLTHSFKKKLRGTLINFLTLMNFAKKQKLISQNEFSELKDKSFNFINESNQLFPHSIIHIIKFYMTLYHLGFGKIKGFNYLAKQIIQF